MIPRHSTNLSRFEVFVGTKKFLQMGWKLIESEDTETRQHVINKLGAETGLVSGSGVMDRVCKSVD
jgi:hypothetical protein